MMYFEWLGLTYSGMTSCPNMTLICNIWVGQFTWLVVLGFNTTLTAKIMPVADANVSLLSHTSTNTTFLPKPPTTFLRWFSTGERQK